MYFIIDDYQECHSGCIDALLEDAVGAVKFLHIVLISRSYPDICYEDMLLKGKCAVFNQKNMTLTRQDTKEIFAINNIELEDSELDYIYNYTDGWISAVYLSLYEYQKNGGFISLSGVSHLLKNVIFNKLSPKMQEFFMKVSLFDWFNIDGAQYVTQMQINAGEIFEYQAQYGFLYYDIKTNSFIMHNLLRNVAQSELNKSDINQALLCNRAGEWSEKKQVYVKAIQYYRMAHNWERIAAIYAGKDGKNIIEQSPELFDEVKEMIKKPVWDNYIMAFLNNLYVKALHEPSSDVLPEYNRISDGINNHESWKNNKSVNGEMMVIQSVLELGDIEKMNHSLQKACRYLGHNTSVLFDNSLLTYGTICMTLLYYNKKGYLKNTISLEKEYAKAYMKLTRGSMEGWDEFFDAEYAMLTADIEQAYKLAEHVCVQNILKKQTCIVISCYYMMLRCLIYKGDKDTIAVKMSELDKLKESIANPLLNTDIEILEGYIYACLGIKEKMPEWIVDFKLENCCRAVRNIRSGCMSYGKLMCVQADYPMLDIVADQMRVPFETITHIYALITGNIYKAIAKYNMGYEELAKDYLIEAIDIAMADDVRIPFIENARELKPVMELVGKDDTSKKNVNIKSFLKSLKPDCDMYIKGINKILKDCDDTTDKKQDINEENIKLTKREKELLEYLNQGLKNNEISANMHIALVTVEKNLTNIYRKLGVTNRTAAILKARQEQLI